jgi:hypothetical protein
MGVVAGLLAFAAAAATAEAQINITGTDPGCVKSTDMIMTYTGTISNATSCNFKLWVYQDGVLKYQSTQSWVNGNAPFQVSQLMLAVGWNLQVGATVTFRAKAWTSPEDCSVHDLNCTVLPPSQTYAPSRAPDGGRRLRPAAIPAAVVKQEEELLA